MIIEYIEGRIIALDKEGIILKTVSGIGYRIQGHFDGTTHITSECQIWIDFRMNQDSIKLYGFLKLSSLKLFRALIQVQGVSSRMAQHILHIFDEKMFVEVIKNKQKEILKQVPGVGIKISEKIIRDVVIPKEILENHIVNQHVSLEFSIKLETQQALLNLGFSQEIIEKILRNMKPQCSLEQSIVEALKQLSSF
jgi:Holliday junction DNA helicase RuvA